jgi:hypothetical protein
MSRLGPLTRDLIPIAESAVTEAARPVATRLAVTETSGSITPTGTPGNARIALIRAGWSLNNSFYSPSVLRASAGKWRKGLQTFADHAPDSEEEDYPSGSIKNLAGVLTSDAVWNESTQCLEADVKLFAPWREALVDMAPYIGMSIRAWVYAQDGEAEGRKGMIVNSIEEARSVDFVTVPAAGGAILSVFEAARRKTREARNVGHWFESRIHSGFTEIADHLFGDGRLTRPERITLSGAVGDALTAFSNRLEADAPQLYKRDPYADAPTTDATTATEASRVAEATAEETRADLADEIAEQYGDEDTYCWVRDYDPSRMLVWFDISSGGESATYQQSYTVADDGDCELTGDKVEVVPRTVYDPAEPEDEPQPADPDETPGEEAAPVPVLPAAIAVAETVTSGDPPAVTEPSEEEGSAVAEVQTGAPPAPAATAPAATAPPTDAASTAVLEAMQALTRQVTALTEANTALTARANTRDSEDRLRRNRDTAREAVTVALAAPEVPQDLREQIGPRVTAAVLAAIPTTDTGDVDLTALGEAITTAVEAESGYAARLLESAGVGRPRGLGATATNEAKTGEEFETEMAKIFQEALGLSAEAAKVAAHGRG